MIEKQQYETYLVISKSEFGIYLLDTINFINLYEQELKFENKTHAIDLNILNQFIEDNIFKIENLVGEFIKNIFIVLEHNESTNITIGIKKKNYQKVITQEAFETSLIDVKDLFKENYQEKKIMHIIVNRYLINNKIYDSLNENLNSDHFCMEIEFKSLSANFASEMNKILGKYQIKIIKFIDGSYIKSFFLDERIEFSEKAHKINNGYNPNEVMVVPINPKKSGFFEKFFQLFS